MKGARSDGENFERIAELFRVDLDEVNREVDTEGERASPDDFFKEGMSNGCFEDGNGLFAEDCGRGVSRGGRM